MMNSMLVVRMNTSHIYIHYQLSPGLNNLKVSAIKIKKVEAQHGSLEAKILILDA